MRVEIGAIKQLNADVAGSVTALEIDFVFANSESGSNLIPDNGHVWMYTSFQSTIDSAQWETAACDVLYR